MIINNIASIIICSFAVLGAIWLIWLFAVIIDCKLIEIKLMKNQIKEIQKYLYEKGNKK